MSHSHSHDGHSHSHRNDGILVQIARALHLPGFGHEHESHELLKDIQDNDLGIRTVWIAFIVLAITTLLQVAIYLSSSSVALLADTVHNLGDALNSLPLLAAFYLARRAANQRYTYGYGRAEDIAGVLIVLSIAFSAAYILWESVQKLIHPEPLSNLGWVAIAAVVGFLGNELVAIMQIRVGKRIGSEAMIADGKHARTDGLSSLAVLIAAVGTWLGFPILDPIIGIVIGIMIVGITWDATKAIWYRLMDAVEPSLIRQIEHYVGEVLGVEKVHEVKARWLGHRLYAELSITVEEKLSVVESYAIAQDIRKVLLQTIPQLEQVSVNIEPKYAREPASKSDMSGLLPPRYQNLIPSPTPMGAAGLVLAADGQVAWDEIWTDFCDLALAGGPSHRGTLLEPVNPATIEADSEAYQKVLDELERGIRMVTGLDIVRSSIGWIGMTCENEEMALWLLRTIVVENISVRREGTTLFFPASPEFSLEKEIKSIITVTAKTSHYWKEHRAANRPSS
jgi:cation diffusion facilitator family transporter